MRQSNKKQTIWVQPQPVTLPVGQPLAAAPQTIPAKPRRGKARRKGIKQSILAFGLGMLFAFGFLVAGGLLYVIAGLTGQAVPGAMPGAEQTPSGRQPLPTALQTLSTQQIIEKLLPSVVSIELYEEGVLAVTGSGSGIVFSEDGYIVTNYHVVNNAHAVRVVLHNGAGYSATVVDTDIVNDLAIIKIEENGLTPAEFGDSDLVQVGDTVIAIGNAAGLPGSPSQGIISGVNRQLSVKAANGQTVVRSYLQTDAAINPGNSGGALVNQQAQVIGINIAKLSSEDIDNIGFALPINTALPLMQNLGGQVQQEESVAKARIGITVRALNETNGPANGLPAWGLYIETIEKDSNLNNHPVAEGDVLVQADGVDLVTMAALDEVLAGHKPGDTLQLVVYRAEKQDRYPLQLKLL